MPNFALRYSRGYNPKLGEKPGGVPGFNGNYGEIREATRPAVIVEIAFMGLGVFRQSGAARRTIQVTGCASYQSGGSGVFGRGALPPPTLVSPGGSSAWCTSTPTLQWQPVTGADGYGPFVSKFNGSTYDLVFNSETDVGYPLPGDIEMCFARWQVAG